VADVLRFRRASEPVTGTVSFEGDPQKSSQEGKRDVFGELIETCDLAEEGIG
jgi:hypothetical protein